MEDEASVVANAVAGWELDVSIVAWDGSVNGADATACANVTPFLAIRSIVGVPPPAAP